MNNTQRITALEAGQARMEALLEQLVAAQTKPAKVARPKAVTRKAVKRTTKPQPKADLALCKATRLRFIAAAAKEGVDFGGMSTKAIAAMCCEDPSLVPAGFRIGEGYAAIYG